jgi:hypothetical protein
VKQKHYGRTIIALALALVVTIEYALWCHRRVGVAREQRDRLATIVRKTNVEVRNYLCDDLDGVECYRLMAEFHSKGLRQATDLKATLRAKLLH